MYILNDVIKKLFDVIYKSFIMLEKILTIVKKIIESIKSKMAVAWWYSLSVKTKLDHKDVILNTSCPFDICSCFCIYT